MYYIYNNSINTIFLYRITNCYIYKMYIYEIYNNRNVLFIKFVFVISTVSQQKFASTSLRD